MVPLPAPGLGCRPAAWPLCAGSSSKLSSRSSDASGAPAASSRNARVASEWPRSRAFSSDRALFHVLYISLLGIEVSETLLAVY